MEGHLMKTRFMIQERRQVGAWLPRAIRYTLKDADRRLKELQALDPQKIFRIIPHS